MMYDKLFKAVLPDRIRYFRTDSIEKANGIAKDAKWTLVQDITEVTGNEGSMKCVFYETPKGFYIGRDTVDIDKILNTFARQPYPLSVFTEDKPYHLVAYDYYCGEDATCYYTENPD